MTPGLARRRISMPKTAFIFIALFALGGCAVQQASHDPADPWEGYNRGVFSVNDTLDTAVVKPVARGYGFLPSFLRKRVANFFGNLADVPNAANNLLQGEFQRAASDAMRVVLNSTFGLVGFFDVASLLQFEKHEEDFGQTLAVWGVGPGPYFVIPVFGPSTLRDFPAKIVDFLMSPLSYLDFGLSRTALAAIEAVDARQRFIAREPLVREISPDLYSAVRSFYLERRRQLTGNNKDVVDESLYEDFGEN